ncbi:hypothetical protein BC349_11290 [Flavihumibacter stibioxidans]|uniref:Uncharacterized protein n=1 Tax=Flavihumibacter stibioxidans TaxID=1834163 RepID=A0ABR7M9M1_9BACT|nr:hypothetical protein [Flavihumibacter stibioxidans]
MQNEVFLPNGHSPPTRRVPPDGWGEKRNSLVIYQGIMNMIKSKVIVLPVGCHPTGKKENDPGGVRC